MVTTRFFGGGASSVAINLVGGSIADIWKGPKGKSVVLAGELTSERSIPMSIFGMTSVVGIALGPFIGGAIQTNQDPLNWHWIFWIQLIVCGGLLPVFWFLLRETRGDVILMKKAKKIRKETGRDVYAKAELDKTSILTNMKVSFLRPTKMLLTEFVVISFTLWVSFGESCQILMNLLLNSSLGTSLPLPIQYPPNFRQKVSRNASHSLMLAINTRHSKRRSSS